MRRRDEVLVGLFTTVAIIILALASIWLVRGGLNRGYLLHSRFAWGSGIKQGAPVWLVGVTVGGVFHLLRAMFLLPAKLLGA